MSSFSSSTTSSSSSSLTPSRSFGAVHIRKLAPFLARKHVFAPGSVVLITGAASGIGKALSLIYAKRRARLILVDIDSSALDKCSKECEECGAKNVLSQVVDATNWAAVSAAVQKSLDEFSRIDLLVLCAGIGAHHLFSSTEDLSMYHKLMNVNFFGYLHFIKAAYPALCAAHGHITAITSFSGEIGLPYRTAYCASKFAVTGFLESLRAEMEFVEKEKKTKALFTMTIVCPPSVDTNLRKNSLTSDAALKEAPAKYSLTVQQCAEAIVDATDRRLRKAFFPFQSWIASYLRPIIPDVMDQMIMKRAKL